MAGRLNSASAKLNQMHKTGQLPRQRKVSSAVLWLAALEASTRASKLLQAMDLDPDQVRATVLTSLATHGAPLPSWPEQVRLGFVTRVVQRVLSRINAA